MAWRPESRSGGNTRQDRRGGPGTARGRMTGMGQFLGPGAPGSASPIRSSQLNPFIVEFIYKGIQHRVSRNLNAGRLKNKTTFVPVGLIRRTRNAGAAVRRGEGRVAAPPTRTRRAGGPWRFKMRFTGEESDSRQNSEQCHAARELPAVDGGAVPAPRRVPPPIANGGEAWPGPALRDNLSRSSRCLMEISMATTPNRQAANVRITITNSIFSISLLNRHRCAKPRIYSKERLSARTMSNRCARIQQRCEERRTSCFI